MTLITLVVASQLRQSFNSVLTIFSEETIFLNTTNNMAPNLLKIQSSIDHDNDWNSSVDLEFQTKKPYKFNYAKQESLLPAVYGVPNWGT